MSPVIHDQELNRKQAADLVRQIVGPRSRTSPATLAVFDCIKRYDLKPIRKNGRVYYLRSVIEEFATRDQRP